MADNEQKLIEALKLALFALNEVPNSRVRHDKYRNSYEIASEIEKTLQSIAPSALGASTPFQRPHE